MVKISTRLIFAVALLTATVNSSAQTDSLFIMGETHTIDLREFTASLQWESADAGSRIQTRRTPAPDNIRWIDRINNLPDYMHDFYDNHGKRVKEVLDGGSNYLSDPDADNTNAVHYKDGTTLVLLKQITRQVLFTFSQDVIKDNPQAKQDLAIKAANDDIQENINPILDEVAAFLPYMFMCMSYDYPQAFWLGNRCNYATSCDLSYGFLNESGRDSVRYNYYILYIIKADNFDCRIEQFRTPQAVKEGVIEYKQLVQNILENNPNTTRYQQVRYLNDWLTKHNAYSSAYTSGDFSPIVWSPISALRGTNGADGPVCEGYARAFKILCDGLNIPCILAVGDAKGSKNGIPESHMWNEVKMNDGQWYAVDVTWNDPLTGAQQEEKVSGAENEKWLLLGKNDVVNTDLTFAESHPNSIVYGQTESAQWDYEHETLIADTHFDIANGIVQPKQEQTATVYSISGQFIGRFESFDDALNSIERGIYIINNRKVLVK